MRLRFRIGVGDEKVVVEAKSMWRRESEECCEMGVAFTQKDAATKVAKAFGNDSTGEVGVPERNCSARVQRGFTVAACALVLCFVLMQLF